MLKWLGETAASTAFTGYGAIEGEAELRQAYAEHVAALYGAAVAAGNIHITSGCNQAFICAAMAVAGAGDTVLMTNPYYFNQETTLAMLGIDVELAPLDAGAGFLPEVETIASALRPGIRALALVSPNNPTGAVYPPGLLQRIYELCRANGTWLILDETYRDFLPDAAAAPHGLLRTPGWEDGFIGLYSFSKSFCIPGHRLGAITAGPQVVEQIARSWTISRSAPRVPRRRGREGDTGACRLAACESRRNRRPRRGAEDDHDPAAAMEAAGRRRLFCLYPPPLPRYRVAIRRREAGEARRRPLLARRLFRRGSGKLSALRLRQCGRGDDLKLEERLAGFELPGI